VVQGCNLFSGTILSPPMLARLLIGSPETVLSAPLSAMVDDCSHMPQRTLARVLN
jgi:hypothetical protein